MTVENNQKNSGNHQKDETKNPFDSAHIENIMNMYKKNLEILSLVNQMSFDVYKSVARLQATFLQQMITDACDACRSKPTDAMQKFATIAKDSMKQAIDNGKQISEILTSTGSDISGVLSKRFKESMEEMKQAYNK